MLKQRYAAIDIGSTCVKSALLCDGQMQIVYRSSCPLSHEGDQVRAHWSRLKHDLYVHLAELSKLLDDDVQLHIGICGQVSSLLVWDHHKQTPLFDDIPVWQDQSCAASLPLAKELLANQHDQKFIGQRLPLACNWLLVKLFDYVQGNQLQPQQQIMQLHDALMQDLCGTLYSHPSSQISMVHVDQQAYHPELLEALGVEKHHLPRLSNNAAVAISPEHAAQCDLPKETYLYPGLADMYAGFIGFGLESGQALWQCNTSEIFGVAGLTTTSSVFMRQQLHDMPIYYGSTVSGGSNINWFLDEVAAGEDLDRLSQAAGQIAPGADGLLYLPYIRGERAPHWQTDFNHAFINVQQHHSTAHKLRAIMEGVAFNKRWLMEFLPAIDHCVLAGGSTCNQVWNQIRADVTGLELALMDKTEIALKGCLRFVAQIRADEAVLSQLDNTVSERYHANAISDYDQVFDQFKQAHQEQGYPMPDNQELHYV